MAKRRRGNGEGAIYQRESDGYWCTTVDLGFVDGKRKRKTIYGRTRKEVADKLKQLQHDQEKGINIAPERLTVGQFLERWLEEVVKPNRRPRTYRSYADTVRLHITPRLGSYLLSKLSAAQVQRMVNALAGTAGARTTEYARAVLQRALNRAVKWDLIPRNVALVAEAPRATPRAIAPLDDVQAQCLLDAVRGHRLEALYRVALSLGLRRGEVLGLLWKDIDVVNSTLRVSGSLQRVQGELKRTPPKTAAGARTLPLPPVLLRALQQHRQTQQEARELRGDDWEDHGLVFPSQRGTPMEPRNLNRHFAAMLKKAGLPASTRFHDLRHSCATLLIAQGVHPRVVMEILGHSQISLTMNTYAHVLPENQREAAAKVDALCGEYGALLATTENAVEEPDQE